MNRATAGFTLAELLAVLLLVGIAAAVAAPAFRPPGRSAAGAAEALRGVYAAARDDAAVRGELVTVSLATATGEYAVTAESADGDVDTLRAGALPLPPEGRIVGERSGAARAVFSPLGRARADRVAIVHGEVRHEISVDAWTGAARTAP